MNTTDDAQRSLSALVQAVLGTLRDLWGRLRTWLPWRMLLLLALFGVLLHVFGFISLPVWPFTTAAGRIYVDSPEVYTRERLVNDRYEQDYWLRQQLRLLDEVTPSDLATARLQQRTAIDLGEDGGGGGEGAAPPDADMEQLSFRARHQVLAGIRDMIRQQILENMLDDRHDLTANSVYGLKFDTTLIPGRNTRRPAFVEVTLRPDNLFLKERHEPAATAGAQETAANDGAAPLADYLRAFVCKQAKLLKRAAADCEGMAADALKDYDKQRDLYLAWLQDLEKRLNTAEASMYQSIAHEHGDCSPLPRGVMPAQYGDLIAKSLEVVLNLPEKRFVVDHRYDDKFNPQARLRFEGEFVRLPEPYSRYMKITATLIEMPPAEQGVGADGTDACLLRAAFDIAPIRESYLARPIAAVAGDANWDRGGRISLVAAGTELLASGDMQEIDGLIMLWQAFPEVVGLAYAAPVFPIWTIADGGWEIAISSSDAAQLREYLSTVALVYDRVPSALLDELARLRLSNPKTAAQYGFSMRDGDVAVELPSGFFNFIESMRELDAYAYAVFPKNDVQGVLRDARVAAGAGFADGALGVLQRLVESRTEPLLTGYGNDARNQGSPEREVRFGWVISNPGRMQPSLKTQLALVSVPAWTDRLTVEVTTGWLNRNGTEMHKEKLGPMEVKLPPDYGAFDSIFRNRGWVTPAPQIQDQEMDQDVYVVAGQNARILIPGLRLWRSTSVTLGSQPADRIRVLPNMEGIIAEFVPVDLPFAKYRPQLGGEDSAAQSAPGTGAEPGTVQRVRTDQRCTLETLDAMADEYQVPDAFRDLEVRPVRLRVWTSEGVAVAAQHACVIYDPQRQIKDVMTAPEGRVNGSDWLPDGGAADAAAVTD
jgi:hypothetical protein